MSDDKEWERVQIKAFTFWVNQFLSEENVVSDITQDFGTGVRLISLFEALTKDKLTTKHFKTPKTRVHYIENIHLALMFLKKSSNIDISNYGTEDFADGNLKSILGFFWGLLRKFSVPGDKSSDGKPFEDSLLQWLRNTLQEYELPIGDFNTSFEDGRIFCALMDKYDSSYLDFSTIDSKNKAENNELAFTTAEQKISIPQLLDPSKVANGKADERSVVLYVSLIQQAYVRKFAELDAEQEKKGFANKLEELKFELDKSNKEKEEYRLSNERNEARILELEEIVKAQKSELEDWESKYLELLKENDLLKKENEEQKKKIQHLEERVKTLEELMSAESSEKSEIDSLRRNLESEIEKLRKEKRDLEEEAEELRQERDHLLDEHKDMIESRDKFKQAQLKLEAEYEAQSQLRLNALGELRKNLVEHVNDMNVWKGYLEQDREYLSETVHPLTEKTIIDSAFEDQLEYLANSLGSENTKLQQLLKERELEEQAKKSEQKSKSKEDDSDKSKKKKGKA